MWRDTQLLLGFQRVNDTQKPQQHATIMKHEKTLKFIYRNLIRVPAQLTFSLPSPSSSEVTSIHEILQALVSQIYILKFSHTHNTKFVLQATCFGSNN